MEESNLSLNQTEPVIETPKNSERGKLFLLIGAIVAILALTAVSLLIVLNISSSKKAEVLVPVEQNNNIPTPKAEAPIDTSVTNRDTQTSKLLEQSPSSDMANIEKDLSDTNFLDLDDGSSNLDISIY